MFFQFTLSTLISIFQPEKLFEIKKGKPLQDKLRSRIDFPAWMMLTPGSMNVCLSAAFAGNSSAGSAAGYCLHYSDISQRVFLADSGPSNYPVLLLFLK